MAATLFGVSDYGSLSHKRFVCSGGNPFPQKGAGNGSAKVLVCICSNSKDQKIGAKKIVKIKFDFINKGLKSRLRIPLFGLFAEEKWAEEGKISESVESPALQNTRKARENGIKSDDEEISARSRSKFVAVSFTPEKAKLLRKTLRSTSTFHDLMYHSAIASRLASAESSAKEGNPS